MNEIPQNNIHFGARLHTNLKTQEAKRLMSVADKFFSRTEKDYPHRYLYIKDGGRLSDRPVLTLGGSDMFVPSMSTEFLGIEPNHTESQIATKLVKAFKIMIEEEKMWADDWNKSEKVIRQHTQRMKEIAGKDTYLKSFVETVKTGLGIW